ncbi:hypothetical protein AVEN_110722-1 [Araneus ventricosus]|uniref:Transposase Tc1-like domain-containing protein n=1 Tax=Araneus ventricosus TaxID=182803 RepID=A0A4Y2AWG4_ARAVE|nr:hypothetical protein AVEN_110722-1 [Araneus ventricosus]
MSITETARLVDCSRSAVVSIHAKWINDGRHQGVDHPRVIKEKGHWKVSRLVKQNWHQTAAQLTAQYNAGPSASVLEHTVQRLLLDMGLCKQTSHSCASVDQASLSTTPTVGPGPSKLNHG